MTSKHESESRLGFSHLRDPAIVLLWLNNLTAVVLQVEEHNHFAHPVILCRALSDCLLEVPIPTQYLKDVTADCLSDTCASNVKVNL